MIRHHLGLQFVGDEWISRHRDDPPTTPAAVAPASAAPAVAAPVSAAPASAAVTSPMLRLLKLDHVIMSIASHID